MLNVIRKLIDLVEVTTMVASMALVTVVITTQVVLRYLFNDSLTWAEELTRFTIIWMSFIAAGMGVRYGGHISVDLLTTVAPARMARPLIVVATLLGIIFGFGLVIFGGNLVLHAMHRHQLSSALQIPMYQVYAVLPLSGVLLIFRYGDFLFNFIAGKELPDKAKAGEIGG